LDALAWWKEELVERRKLSGELHVDTLGCLRWMGRAAFTQGLFAEAELWSRQAMEGYDKREGNSPTEDSGLTDDDLEEDTHDTRTVDRTDGLDSAFWTGRACFAQDRWKDAEKWLRKAVKGYRKLLGRKHGYTTVSTFWLARALYEQRLWEVAQKLFTKAVSGYREVHGLENADTLNRYVAIESAVCGDRSIISIACTGSAEHCSSKNNTLRRSGGGKRNWTEEGCSAEISIVELSVR
jgi:tetratricopeptide (TPR) repeat protein